MFLRVVSLGVSTRAVNAANVVVRIGACRLSLHRRTGGEPAICGTELVAAIRWVVSRRDSTARQATALLSTLLSSAWDAAPTYEVVLADEVREWHFGYLIALEQETSWASGSTVLQTTEWRACVVRLNPDMPAFEWDFEVHTSSIDAFALEIAAL